MSALVKVFEGHTVRVLSENDGTPMFIAKDVCDALGLANVSAALGRVDEEDITSTETLTDGGTQKVLAINESGLYALILGSRKAEAKRFKRWVTSEVLPAVRKTGGYASLAHENHTRSPAASPYDIAGQWLIRAGVSAGIAAAHVLNQLEANTGTNMDAFRKALPSTTEPVSTLNATELGKLVGMGAAATNMALAAAGLQLRSGKDWALTEAGKAHGAAFPYERNGHASYQVRWKPSAAALIGGAR